MMNNTVEPLEGTPVTAKKLCRICLDEEGPFIAPCCCSGSVKYIHYKCLEEWLLKSVTAQTSYLDFKRSKCEICSTRYSFKSTRTRHFDCGVLKKNAYVYRSTYMQFILALVIVLGLALALIILIIIINNNPTFNQSFRELLSLPPDNNMSIIFASTIFVLLCGVLVLTIIFLIEFGLKSNINILGIENYSTIRSNSVKGLNKCRQVRIV
jgi:hypothetical protein